MTKLEQRPDEIAKEEEEKILDSREKPIEPNTLNNMSSYPLNFLEFKNDEFALFICYDANTAIKLEKDITDSDWKHLCSFVGSDYEFHVMFGRRDMRLFEW